MKFFPSGSEITKWLPYMLLIAGFLVGYFVGHKPVRELKSDLITNDHLRDSLVNVANDLYKSLDLAYAEKSKVIIKEKIRYVTRIKELEVSNYVSMDTIGRVDYFHTWVIDSTKRYIANRNN